MCYEKKQGAYPNCKGYAQTYKKDDKTYLKKAKNHCHAPNKTRIDLCHFMIRLKERVLTDRTTQCTKIYDEEIVNCSPELLGCLPLRDSVINTLNRHRRKFIRGEEQKLIQASLKPDDLTNSIDLSSNLVFQSTIKTPTKVDISQLSDHIHEPFIEPNAEVEILVNHKGAIKLNLNGFLLVRKSKKDSSTYWMCQRNPKQQKCYGNAITYEKDGKHFLKGTRPHNHIACDEDSPEVSEVMLRMKERARQTDESVAKIFDDIVKDLPMDIRSKLPPKDSAKRSLSRYRMKFRSNVVIEPKYTNPPEVEEVLNRMKKRISATMETPSTVYNDETRWVSPYIMAMMPKREKTLKALKSRKRRAKVKNAKEELDYEEVSLVHQLSYEKTSIISAKDVLNF